MQLTDLLAKLWPEAGVVGQADDGFQALQLLDALKPDIGPGIAGIRERLDALYGADASLGIRRGNDGGCRSIAGHSLCAGRRSLRRVRNLGVVSVTDV